MGLLTAALSLAREPLRLTFRVWEFGLSTAAEAARIGGELLDPERGPPPPDLAEPWPPAEPEHGNGRPSRAEATEAPDEPPPVPDEPPSVPDEPPPVPDEPPPVPDELIPDHVDEEPVLVAEAAEEGAADGAGAELHVEAPWDGYDQMTAADIRDRLVGATPAEAAAVELYESAGRQRRSILDAAARALNP